MFHLLYELKWFYKAHKKSYHIALTALVFIDVFILVPPMFVGIIRDGLQSNTLTFSTYKLIMALLFSLSLINYILGYFADFYLFNAANAAMHELRKKIMEKLIHQNPFFFHHHSSGEIMSRSTGDVSSLGDYTGFGMMALMDSTFYPAVILLLMMRISWQLTLVSILPLPLLIFASKYLEGKIDESFTRAQKRTDELSAMVLAHSRGLRVLRAYVQEEAQEEKLNTLSESLRKDRNDVSKYVSLFNFTGRAIPGMSFFLAMAFGVAYVRSGLLSLGGLVSINLYLGMLSWPMMAFGEYMAVNQQAKTSWGRIQELLNFDDEPLPKGGILSPGGNLSFKDVNFSYTDNPSLIDINLDLPQGKRLGIVGPIGSGKTTLLRQLLGIYPLVKGIRLDGQDFEDIDLEKYRQTLGFVPQEHILFSKTLKKNILLGEEESPYLCTCLDMAGFLPDLVEMPLGMETLLGENGINLSGGQKQRLSLARALYRKPKFLLLDDTLSAVDNLTQSHIEKHLEQLPKETTLLLISHRLSAVKNCDETIVLNQGRISERGTHQELLGLRGWYWQQWLLQGGNDV
ncbi:MAG: ABC transporter ATP-binding protein [Tissierellia bacterium]|nr:ABC transporter ATP-binding protein [Tissierellia bacterium]